MIKRIFDIFFASLGLILLSPVLIIVASFIKILTPGPVLFFQKRTGRYGIPFTIVKFRTMKVGKSESTMTVKGDSRITDFGVILRRYKLDELPELWNVLIGDMSLVGPRPDTPEFTNRLQGNEKCILELRPGITGQASLKYSNEEELLSNVDDPVKYTDEVLWPDKVKINMEYYDNHGIVKDIALILKTISNLFR
ncbi:MAG: sugar transferase [Clostridiaceae bacterium]|nr:sugar transferase [Clostridiaceae bacterium]